MTHEPLMVLLVEDSSGDAAWIRDSLKRIASGAGVLLGHSPTLGEALERLGRGGIDVVLLDLNLPDATGLETLRKLGGRFPEVPVVVLTGLHDEEAGLAAVNCG
ncbi:MAG: response regulator, partial [Planctomycetes bacterium]|nr:response regulator [Planctomycetota bacterium]